MRGYLRRLSRIPGLVLSVLGSSQLRVLRVGEHGRGREKPAGKRAATPGRLDEKNLLVVMISHDMPKVELRAKTLTWRAVADGQVAMFPEVVDPDIAARAPEIGGCLPLIIGVRGLFHLLRESIVVAILEEMSIALTVLLLAHLPGERFGETPTFHIGLTGKDEDLHLALAL